MKDLTRKDVEESLEAIESRAFNAHREPVNDSDHETNSDLLRILFEVRCIRKYIDDDNREAESARDIAGMAHALASSNGKGASQ